MNFLDLEQFIKGEDVNTGLPKLIIELRQFLHRICRVANISERTLQYAFRDRFGIPPKSYLTALRLNGIRRDLRRADPASTRITGPEKTPSEGYLLMICFDGLRFYNYDSARIFLD